MLSRVRTDHRSGTPQLGANVGVLSDRTAHLLSIGGGLICARLNLRTFCLPGLKERSEDIELNLARGLEVESLRASA